MTTNVLFDLSFGAQRRNGWATTQCLNAAPASPRRCGAQCTPVQRPLRTYRTNDLHGVRQEGRMRGALCLVIDTRLTHTLGARVRSSLTTGSAVCRGGWAAADALDDDGGGGDGADALDDDVGGGGGLRLRWRRMRSTSMVAAPGESSHPASRYASSRHGALAQAHCRR